MNIKDIRTRKGLTQAEVASSLGVSSVVYSRYETGSRQPSIDILIQLADIFGVTVDYLLGRQDIEDSTLSEYELSLLIASRKADERAKQDALNMLLAHAVKTNQKNYEELQVAVPLFSFHCSFEQSIASEDGQHPFDYPNL